MLVYSCSDYCCFYFEGDKIEAIARKGLMSKFKSELREGKVYTITYFSVLSNSGGFMASEHDYKIMFNEKTRVAVEEVIGIPMTKYSFKDTDQILATGGDSDFLIGMLPSTTSATFIVFLAHMLRCLLFSLEY